MTIKKTLLLITVTLGFLAAVWTPAVLAQTLFETVRYSPNPFDVTTGIALEPVIAEELRDRLSDATLEYRWYLNGEEVLQEITPHFPGEQLNRGDQLSIEITLVLPGGDRLPPFISQPFEVSNANPTITSDPSTATTTGNFIYQVTATDPDGDYLTFHLESGPDYMTIDATTGLLQWRFETMPEGSFPVKIVVDDGVGGQATQAFELQTTFQK